MARLLGILLQHESLVDNILGQVSGTSAHASSAYEVFDLMRFQTLGDLIFAAYANSGYFLNSILPWKAIMRGELSPPSPTPSRPVGGEMVLCIVPERVGIIEPGTPASTLLGSAKFA